MEWNKYHEATKHTVERLRASRHFLDWANMPDPFRHYEGVPVLDLPAEATKPAAFALDVLFGGQGEPAKNNGAGFLSELLFHSAAISATKRVPSTGYEYALRVNPSSGNLHPTEFHFAARGLRGWPNGLYHYRPSSHMAEQRAVGDFRIDFAAPVVFVLTSIAWREAWKYRDRAYRYCLHDIGHAWQALAVAARAMGCEASAFGDFDDDEVAEALRLPEDEWPMMAVEIRGGAIPIDSAASEEPKWFGGTANRLSEEVIPYPSIYEIHSATKVQTHRREIPGAGSKCHDIALPTPDPSSRMFADVVRGRRSALDFIGGERTMSLARLAGVLRAAGSVPDFGGPFVELYLYAHRIDGLKPGVYRYCAEQQQLGIVTLGDQRVAAAGLSLGQDLAGNACVAFSMIGYLRRATAIYGDRGYRYVHFEAGALGQRLYLAAEAYGMGATGIGAFYDEQVHSYLNLGSGEGQAVYHFAVGYPIPDPRLGASY